MHLVFDQYLRATCPEISQKELHKQMVINFVCGLLPLSQHTIQGKSLLSSSSRWWSESDWGLIDTWTDDAWKSHGLPRKVTCISRMISSGNAWPVLPWSWPCIYVLLKFLLHVNFSYIYFPRKYWCNNYLLELWSNLYFFPLKSIQTNSFWAWVATWSNRWNRSFEGFWRRSN